MPGNASNATCYDVNHNINFTSTYGHHYLTDDHDCYMDHQLQLDVYGNPLTLMLSIFCILGNCLVCRLIRRSMGKKPTQAQQHLLGLCISDITVGAMSICRGILSYICELCLPCAQASTCVGIDLVFSCFWLLYTVVNQWITFYITMVRAWAVSCIMNTLTNQRKSQRRVLVEFLLFGVLGGILIYAILEVMFFIYPLHYSLILFVMLCPCVIFMAISAIYILVRLRMQTQVVPTITGALGSVRADDFQRLVALVALVFCFTHLFSAIIWGIIVFVDDNFYAVRYLILWSLNATIFNSTANFFIYIASSTLFRQNFVAMVEPIWDKIRH